MIPESVRNCYLEDKKYIEKVSTEVNSILHSYGSQSGYPVIARIKGIDSVAEKLETGRYKNWSELDDLVAGSVIVPSYSHEDGVVNYLKDVFEIVTLKKRSGTNKSPGEFRFDSTRVVCRLNSPVLTTDRDRSHDILFEIQVRTAFDYAWSIVTHDVVYKGNSTDWRRIRLSAQIKAGVEQLDQIVEAFTDSADRISESDWPDVRAKMYIESYFKSKIESNLIPSECAPKDWTRFSQNFISYLRKSGLKYNELVPYCKGIGQIFDTYLVDWSIKGFPLSISLFQFSIGVLITEGRRPRGRVYPLLITSELVGCFPSTCDVEPVVDLK